MNLPILPAAPCQVGWLTNVATGERIAARCKSWMCPDCGPTRARGYRRRLEPVGWTYLLTFTLEGDEWKPFSGKNQKTTGKKAPPYTIEQIKEFNKRWRMLRQWMRRHLSGKEFVWVNELGEKNGRLHRHCLITARWFRYGALRLAARCAGFGRSMRFDRLRTGSRGGSSYVTKYLTAGLKQAWPKGARRIQTNVPRLRSDGWVFEKLEPLPRKPTWWSENKPQWLMSLLDLTQGTSSMGATNAASGMAVVSGATAIQFELILTPREKLHQKERPPP